MGLDGQVSCSSHLQPLHVSSVDGQPQHLHALKQSSIAFLSPDHSIGKDMQENSPRFSFLVRRFMNFIQFVSSFKLPSGPPLFLPPICPPVIWLICTAAAEAAVSSHHDWLCRSLPSVSHISPYFSRVGMSGLQLSIAAHTKGSRAPRPIPLFFLSHRGFHIKEEESLFTTTSPERFHIKQNPIKNIYQIGYLFSDVLNMLGCTQCIRTVGWMSFKFYVTCALSPAAERRSGR